MNRTYFSTPPIEPSKFEFPDSIAYFGAMGFEERALSFLKEAQSREVTIGTTCGIDYLPKSDHNRVDAFLGYAKECSEKVEVLTYDRFSPEQFSRDIPRICRNLREDTIIVDISGLSKLGIVILLNGMSEWKGSLTVFYAEARTYHPTLEAYEATTKKEQSEYFPGFLTTNVYDILSTSGLSSVDMSGYPIALVASPTFNRFELSALLSEINPQKFFLLEGRPPDPSNEWRLRAVEEINSHVKPHAETIEVVSTLRYAETLDALESFYDQVRYTHRVVVAPTGSKMQSLAVFIFKKMHPDVQVLYPVVEKFNQEYTDGSSNLWQIDFGVFSDFISSIGLVRKKMILDLLAKLDDSGLTS